MIEHRTHDCIGFNELHMVPVCITVNEFDQFYLPGGLAWEAGAVQLFLSSHNTIHPTPHHRHATNVMRPPLPATAEDLPRYPTADIDIQYI